MVQTNVLSIVTRSLELRLIVSRWEFLFFAGIRAIAGLVKLFRIVRNQLQQHRANVPLVEKQFFRA